MSPRIKAQHVQSSVINGDYRGQLGPKLRDGVFLRGRPTAFFARVYAFLRVFYAELFILFYFIFSPGVRDANGVDLD